MTKLRCLELWQLGSLLSKIVSQHSRRRKHCKCEMNTFWVRTYAQNVLQQPTRILSIPPFKTWDSLFAYMYINFYAFYYLRQEGYVFVGVS